jgi:hypothetical protein
MSMTCRDLAARIEEVDPSAMPRDVARLCLLMANHVDDFEELDDDRRLSAAWQEMGIRLQAASDQHAAMAEELQDVAQCDATQLTPAHVRILLRAIKIQSQILQLYVGRSRK